MLKQTILTVAFAFVATLVALSGASVFAQTTDTSPTTSPTTTVSPSPTDDEATNPQTGVGGGPGDRDTSSMPNGAPTTGFGGTAK